MGLTNTAIILAGGKSRRMGLDKQVLTINNKRIIDTLIEKLEKIFTEIIIVTNKPASFANYPQKIVKDEVKDGGPLAGIHVGLKHSSSLYNYIIACDMPYINIDYIEYMKKLIDSSPSKKDGVVTRFREHIEPFNGFYSKELVDKIEMNLMNKKRSIHTILEDADILYVSEKKAREFSLHWEMFINLNSLEDLREYGIKKPLWD